MTLAIGPSIETTAPERLGPAPLRAYPSDARFAIAPARWVQRAVNAWRHANPGNGPLIVVDGRAGSITMRALNAISPAYAQNDNYPTNRSVTSEVLIQRGLHDRLAQLPPVRDPVPPPRTTPTPDPSSTTTGTSADTPILDTGSSGGDTGSGGGGYGGDMSGYGSLLLIGGAVLIGLGMYRASRGGAMGSFGRYHRRARRRRR